VARAVAVGSIAISNLALNDTHTITLPSEFATAGAPNYLRFWIMGRSDASSAVGSANADFCHGFAASPSQRFCHGAHEDDGTASSRCHGAARDDCVIALYAHGTTGASDGQVDIDSISTTQVVLINDVALGHAIVIGYEIATFDNGAVGTFNEPGATGVFTAVSGLSFQPTHIELIVSGATALNTIGGAFQHSYGFANGSQQAVAAMLLDNNTTSQNAISYAYDGECGATASFANTVVCRLSFSSFTSDGFQLDCLERNSTRVIGYIAVRGGSSYIDKFSVPTTDGGTSARSTYGFQPRSVAVLSILATGPQTQDTALTTQAGYSIGAADDQNGDGTPGNQHAQSFYTPDATPNMEVGTAIRYDAAHVNVDSAGALNGYGKVQSFDSGGLTWVQTDATGAADYVIVRAFLPPDLGSSGTTYNQSVSGAASFAGAVVRQIGKSPAGAITPSATLVRQSSKLLAGSASPSGTLIRSTSKSMTGAISPSATVTTIKAVLRSMSGSISPSGALIRRAGKTLAGVLAPAGSISRQTSKLLDAAITPVASITKSISRSISAALSFAGSITSGRNTSQAVTGAVSFTGDIASEEVETPEAPTPILLRRWGRFRPGMNRFGN
jgi:hypothetical protein